MDTDATKKPGARSNAQLETLFMLALTAFDRGAYEDAAQLFAQTLLDVPKDPSGDILRHLLIQHIGWALLGNYDVHRNPSSLDQGEAMLERYLFKHEQLRPMADAEREDIYALLGEYQTRREDETPAKVTARLRTLTLDTARNIKRTDTRIRKANEDRMVREIEVEGTKWAQLDDPTVQRWLRDPRYGGSSLFENQGEPFNPTRVLVRGWVPPGHPPGAGRLAFERLRRARPALERCYEQALGRGAEIVERVKLDINWSETGTHDASFATATNFDASSRTCMLEALSAAESGAKAPPANRAMQARLHLTFFIQPERRLGRGDLDYDYFGRWAPPDAGQINHGASPEDVSLDQLPPLQARPRPR